MRFLQHSDNGEFRLSKEFFGDDRIPPYAILSHTWGSDADEVTFEDLKSNTGNHKAGYEKIRFCGEQARQDGLQYFWVDTCCINKANYAELSQAINSMFHWYRNASKCYVYLSDVSITKQSPEFTWEPSFRGCRWFTRGWTLQELLAPQTVEFFSVERIRLGDKSSLRQQIHAITGISELALQGAPLSRFSVNERLSWMERRWTKLEEDRVYSLLGIFGVYIPTIYNEGVANAFRRLRDEINKLEKCIQDLRLTDPRDDKKRIEDTKGGLLQESYHWILQTPDFQQWHHDHHSRLLWINGDPGKGKTMLLCGIANELEKSKAWTDLISFFFCQATDSRINNASAVLRGLIFLLLDQQPLLISHIQKKHDQAGKTLFEDTNSWFALSEIFTNILQDPILKRTFLIIDALDECISDLPKLLDFIAQNSSITHRVKWVVSSRNWPEIKERLDIARYKVGLSLELNAESVSRAVSIYIHHKTLLLAQRKKYNNELRDAIQDHLSSNANNTFLWVALVCQDLEKIPRWNTLAKLNTFPPGLNSLYKRMIEQICNSDNAGLYKQILATIANVYQPITLKELTSLVEMLEDMLDDLESLREIIALCGSFLTIREDTIYFVHHSAKDYLFQKTLDKVFPLRGGEAHYMIVSRSLQVMSRTLRRDVYSLHALGYPIEQVKQPDPDPLEAIRYSCIQWVNHLCDWNSTSYVDHRGDLQDGGIVDIFIREKYLYWLEALSVYRSMSEGVILMARLDAIVQGRSDSLPLIDLVQDARRFIMYHKWAIENSPLQTYVSALLFSPAYSLTRILFKKEEPKWVTIKPSMIYKWSACLQTLEGHSGPVSSVAFSHNSIWLASASGDMTVKIWDTSTGKCLQTLEGHSDWVKSAAFSHDSTRLASASDDTTVKIWDTSSCECLQTLEGHSSWVDLVAFSHNSIWLASASGDMTVKIWDTSTGKCLQTLEGHSDWVRSAAFSHNSTRLASASSDMTVKIWDTGTGKCLQTLEDHSGPVSSVAFSHNSIWLASASGNMTVKIWDTCSGECLQTLNGHSGRVMSVAFSHESTRLASASNDTTVKIWDTGSGECLQTFEGHSSWVGSVALSSDSLRLGSASGDKTVKIWDASTSESLQTLKDHSSWVTSVTFSHNSTRLASTSSDMTVKIWDTRTGKCLQTLEGHNGPVSSVAFSHNSIWLASTSGDMTVKIWDTCSGECLQTLNGHSGRVMSVAFSHESTRLASASNDTTVKIWDTGSGECLQTLEGHSGWVRSVAFSHDLTWLASTSDDTTVKIWDTGTGKCLQTLEGHSGWVRSVAFSHDSTRLASASDDTTVKIWDTSSCECLQTLSISKTVLNISFDTTGSYLHTEIGIIAISTVPDLSTTRRITNSQTPLYQGWALSLDRAWITYNSENKVRLPSEYRPSCSAVSGNTIGIGIGSGRILIFNFKADNV